MQYYEPIAVYVMEQVSEPCTPYNITRHKDNGLYYVRYNTVLQSLDVFNRNRRLYTVNAIKESLAAPHIIELMSNGQWKGEAGHPLSNDPKRILTIDPKLTSHKINKIWFEGNLVKGEIETLDDVDGYGRKMTNDVLQGGRQSFSLRAMCPLVKKPDGSAICNKKGHIVTYDWVILPSHIEAYMDRTSPIQKVCESLETFGNGFEDIMTPVQESSLLDFITEESKNVKLVSNIAEITTENMILTDDKKFAILKEGTDTFYVKLEDKIKHEVRNYMSRL